MAQDRPSTDTTADKKKISLRGQVITDDGEDPDSDFRQSGIDIVGEVPWGTHFCQFYQSQQDLIETLIPYFAAGLRSNESCVWITSEPLGTDQALKALRDYIPDIDDRIQAGQMEILSYTKWYLIDGEFDQHRVLECWKNKLKEARRRGFVGLRLSGNTFWLDKERWQVFTEYEQAINTTIDDLPIIVLCTYSLDKCGAVEILDVISNHEYALLKRDGKLISIESSTHKQTRQALQKSLAELDDLNKALVFGAAELDAANSQLRDTMDSLRREVDERKQAESLLQKINRTLRAHINSSRAMMHARNETDYLNEVCRIVAEDCGHTMVWIGYAGNDAEKTVRPVAHCGFDEDYLKNMHITWDESLYGCGPSGTAIRSKQVSVCRNMLADPRFEPWREQAISRGYASSVAIPILSNGRVFGVISIYSNVPDAFSSDEIGLLSSLTDDLGYGISAIRLREKQARTAKALEESEKRVKAKLDSIIMPDGDIGNLALSDILDLDSIQSLMNSFYELTKIPMAIIDPAGEVIVKVGWQKICTHYHRMHPDARRYCLESDIELSAGVKRGEVRLYKCKNNLWDLATPIIIGDKHLGNLYTGQFLFSDEQINYDFFRRQAEKYNFNVDEYLQALESVPRVNRETLNRGMKFFMMLAEMLSQLSFANIHLARSLTQLKRAEIETAEARAEAERRTAELESFIFSLHDGLILFDSNLDVVMVNDAFKQLMGASDDNAVINKMATWKIYWLDGAPVELDEYPSHRALRGQVTRAVRYRLVSPWKEAIVSVSGAPVRDSQGNILGGTLLLQDVADLIEYEAQREEIYIREHHISQVLQQALVPPMVPTRIGRFSIGVRYQSALRESEVGGDFYDVFDLGDNKAGVLIGDVAGKGLAAAMRVAAARYALRSYAVLESDPARVLELTNKALCMDSDRETGVLTAIFAVIDASGNTITYASAGHEPPLICRASGEIEELPIGGLPLGVFEFSKYEQDTIELATNDTIVLVTDGITEARTGIDKFFEKKGMIHFLANRSSISPDETASGLLGAAMDHAGGHLQDDAAIVVLSLDTADKAGSLSK